MNKILAVELDSIVEYVAREHPDDTILRARLERLQRMAGGESDAPLPVRPAVVCPEERQSW